MKPPENPFSKMLVSFVPERFFGRGSEIQLILQGISSRDPRSFALYGVKTIGTTSLLKYLCHPEGAAVRHHESLLEYGPDLDRELIFLYVDLYEQQDPLPRLYRGLQRSDAVRRVIGESMDPGLEPANDVERTVLRRAIRGCLRELRDRDARLVVCLDHFDHAFRFMDRQEDVFLRDLTTYQAFIVVTEQSLPKIRRDQGITSPLVNVLMPRNIELLSQDEAGEFVRTPAADVGAPFTDSEVAFILEMAGRHPYLLTIVCEYLFALRLKHPESFEQFPSDEGTRQRVIRQMEELPDVSALFDLYWKRLDQEECRDLLKIASSEWVRSEDGLPTLEALKKKALVYERWSDERLFVFSGLFRRYLARQRGHPVARDISDVASQLAPLDRQVFEYLLARPNQVCTFEELLAEFWPDQGSSRRGLQASISRIRDAIRDVLGEDWKVIRNKRGKGYQYVPRQR